LLTRPNSEYSFCITVYAQWANTKTHVGFAGINNSATVPDFGSASMPMLGYINLNYALRELFLNKLFDNVSLGQFPNLQGIIHGLLPDMTMRVPADAEPPFYCERLAEIAHHELAHGSHFAKVGHAFWLNFIATTLTNEQADNDQNPYGLPADYIDIAESWAEFLGTNHALRRYPNELKRPTEPTISNTFPLYRNAITLIEEEGYFFGGQWIPYGMYHDFMDGFNPNEPWDNVQGMTIQQLYNLHGAEVTNRCDYVFRFFNVYGMNTGWFIFNNHNVPCF
jgi:hypothetical protein